MRCPYCNGENTQVKDSRPTEENAAIRRRRVCEDCGGRFTTFERVQLREIFVVKRSGRRVPFDREKLSRSVEVALRKRPMQPERVERLVSGLVRQLESMGEQDVPSSVIGELVMEALKGLDPVAYVRFASVYRYFREAADFQEVLGEIAGRARASGEASATESPAPRAAQASRQKALSSMNASERISGGQRAGSPVHGARPACGAAHPRPDRAQSGRRRHHRRRGDGRSHGPGMDADERPSARRGACAGQRRRAGPRQDHVRHARALLLSRPHLSR